MVATGAFRFSPVVSFTHFATEGKLDNLVEAADHFEMDHVVLSLLEPSTDPAKLDEAQTVARLTIVKAATRYLKKNHAITAGLALPGLLAHLDFGSSGLRALKRTYQLAVQTQAKTIWVNDAIYVNPLAGHQVDWFGKESLASFSDRYGTKVSVGQLRRNLLTNTVKTPLAAKDQAMKSAWFAFQRKILFNLARTVERAVHQVGPSIQLGLMAASPTDYSPAVQTSELAHLLDGNLPAVLAESEAFPADDRRTAILASGTQLARSDSASQTNDRLKRSALIDVIPASSFIKAAESTQMQINLNLLFGRTEVLFNGFDETGTALGSENIYLRMVDNRQKLIDKLTRLLPRRRVFHGVQIIDNDVNPAKMSPRYKDLAEYQPAEVWLTLLWRYGMAANMVRADAIGPKLPRAVSVLTGDIPRALNGKQLQVLFEHGVLIDALAAETLQEMGYGDWMGLQIGGPTRDVKYEILSDQTLASPYYGYRTVMTPHLSANDFRSLKPVADGVQRLTTLVQENRIPSTPGILAYDNDAAEQRCAVLPYSFRRAESTCLLTVQRQRHFHDLFCWLGRRRLDCFVESSPDLVPFYLSDLKRERLILALLNISYDWAIESRIRLGELPKRVRRIRELNEDSQLKTYPDLKLVKLPTYTYFQLNADTAIPPMQMGLFVLD